EAARPYVRVCRSCHTGRLDQLAAAGKHVQSQDCLECHMPKRRTDDVVHVVMTDHYIQRHKPARDLLAAVPEARETERNYYQGEVVLLYPPRLAPTGQNELYLAVAQVAEGANQGGDSPIAEGDRDPSASGSGVLLLSRRCLPADRPKRQGDFIL